MSVQQRIPLSLEDLPQQRLVSVRLLPPKPAELDVHVVYLRDTESLGLPDKPGRNCEYLASLEWACSPMDNRQDHYFLSQDRKGWYLWNRYVDDLEDIDFEAEEGFISLQPAWYLLSHCNAMNLTEREVAIHLLQAFLDDERSDEALDRFHFVADVGRLSVADLHAIGREVWSGEGEGGDEGA